MSHGPVSYHHVIRLGICDWDFLFFWQMYLTSSLLLFFVPQVEQVGTSFKSLRYKYCVLLEVVKVPLAMKYLVDLLLIMSMSITSRGQGSLSLVTAER
jgi:hypothetical protein